MFKTKKQLKEEISRLEKENKSINQERLSLLKNRTINYEMLNRGWQIELERKDKIIDLIARAFKQDDVRTVEEIKKYFERKSEE